MSSISNMGDSIFRLPEKIQTRWASAENISAIKGTGGKAGNGRKGSPWYGLRAGESFIMAHAEGSGTIRRIWVTISERSLLMLRGIKLEIFWDGETKPAVQAPLGDFFCNSLGRTAAFENTWFSSPEGRSFNCIIPMPFKKGMKIITKNETDKDLDMFFFEVDFTTGDNHDADTLYFHAYYRRENPTKLKQDFQILPFISGKGRYLGCNMGVIANTEKFGKSWWGEGEVKIYLDGDNEYPTLCGTGTEDYIGTGWGQGYYSNMYQGCQIADEERMQYAFYRLHDPDPVYFFENIKVTIQQIGNWGPEYMIKFMEERGIKEINVPGYGALTIRLEDLKSRKPDTHNIERFDDWCSTAYFYLDKPVNELPEIEDVKDRIAGLTGDSK